MATNVTNAQPHQSRRIRWVLVASITGAVLLIPLGIWYYGVISRAPAPTLMTVGGDPTATKDIVEKPPPPMKKVEPAPEKPKEEPVDKRWEEATFRQQMALFDAGWQEYFRLRQSGFDRGMQRTDARFKQEMQTVETRYAEAQKALRSTGDGNIYNNTEKTGGMAGMATVAASGGATGNEAFQEEARLNHDAIEAASGHGQQAPSGQLAQASPLSTHYLTAPRSPYVLYAGTHLPITLDQWMNSDASGGSWVGHVNADVYDSLYSKALLIPAGARVVGVGDPSTDNNEQPVLNLKMTLLMFPPNVDYPNGAYLAAPGMNAQDALGIQGISGPVNNHYWQRYGSAAILALVSAGVSMAAYQGPHGYGGNGFYLAPQDAAAQGFGQVLGQVIAEELHRKLRIRPTVTVPMGYNFIATFQQIQEFPGPYRR